MCPCYIYPAEVSADFVNSLLCLLCHCSSPLWLVEGPPFTFCLLVFSYIEQRPNHKWDYVCHIQYNMYRGQRGPSGLLRNSILSLLFTSWRTKSLVAGWFNISSLSDKQRGNLYTSILTYLACIFCFVSVPYTLPKYPIAWWLADMFLWVVKWPSGYRNVNVDLKEN